MPALYIPLPYVWWISRPRRLHLERRKSLWCGQTLRGTKLPFLNRNRIEGHQLNISESSIEIAVLGLWWHMDFFYPCPIVFLFKDNAPNSQYCDLPKKETNQSWNLLLLKTSWICAEALPHTNRFREVCIICWVLTRSPWDWAAAEDRHTVPSPKWLAPPEAIARVFIRPLTIYLSEDTKKRKPTRLRHHQRRN